MLWHLAAAGHGFADPGTSPVPLPPLYCPLGLFGTSLFSSEVLLVVFCIGLVPDGEA